ncbi:hypothetical protein GOBAR_AA34395 [Gossypium barbadense]|uniref:Uncharacterized protein n=1 Tax=Gossypium barbadense TaxID=3634 RepID=A0A2P5W5A4_GOSBA|nr:hypothetical protein GOBAR_AA34395 [Gossypium barbadense]
MEATVDNKSRTTKHLLDSRCKKRKEIVPDATGLLNEGQLNAHSNDRGLLNALGFKNLAGPARLFNKVSGFANKAGSSTVLERCSSEVIVDVTTLKSWNGLDPSRHSAITFKETHEPSTNNLLERRIVVMMGKGKNKVAGKNSRENKVDPSLKAE